MEYSFPFSTCEQPFVFHGIPVQRVSTLLNILSSLVLSILAFQSKSASVMMAILFFSVFECWHAFSHAVHMPGHIQAVVIHLLNYGVVFSTMVALHALIRLPLRKEWGILILAFSMEFIIYILRRKDQYSVVGGTALFVIMWVLVCPYIPPRLYGLLALAATLFIIGVICFFVEHYFCERLMRWKQLPYHALVEVVTMMFLITVAIILIRWQNKIE